MTVWIEPAQLLRLAKSVDICGVESPKQVIMRNPSAPIHASEPGLPPLDLATYEVRMQRANEGVGPVAVGMQEFIDVLSSLAEPARVISIRGKQTTYIYLLDVALSRVLAAVAIERPETVGGRAT